MFNSQRIEEGRRSFLLYFRVCKFTSSAFVRLWISLCTGARTHTRARACIYIVLFMENRATESDRQSRQGACAAFRGWVTNLSTYANQSSNPRRYVVITANPRFHCSHPSRGSSFSSPSPSPSSHTNARSDHQTIKYTEDLSRPSSTSLYDDFETGESFNYSYFWIISRILQVPFSFPLVIHERQIRSSDDKMHEDLSLPSTILKQVNLSNIFIFGSFGSNMKRVEMWTGNGSTKSISICIILIRTHESAEIIMRKRMASARRIGYE